MEKMKYSIRELEDYLLRKNAGQINVQMEEHINSNSFIQTIVIGLEKKLMENNNTSTIKSLASKKQQLWQRMEHEALVSNLSVGKSQVDNTLTKTAANNFLNHILNYFSLKNYNPYYLQIHLLLGFNCSCVFALVLIACLLNNSEDATLLVSHLDGLVGYRP